MWGRRPQLVKLDGHNAECEPAIDVDLTYEADDDKDLGKVLYVYAKIKNISLVDINARLAVFILYKADTWEEMERSTFVWGAGEHTIKPGEEALEIKPICIDEDVDYDLLFALRDNSPERHAWHAKTNVIQERRAK